jgi:hypothetical protein
MSASYEPVLTYGPETNRPVLIHRPMVEVRVIGPSANRSYRGRLDTGADETLLPWTAIEILGVSLIPGKSLEIFGIGGSEHVMFGLVDLEIQGADGPIRWSHRVGFSPSGRTLFGLTGFLEYFVARFDGVKHEIKLQYRGKAPAPRFEPPAPRRAR